MGRGIRVLAGVLVWALVISLAPTVPASAAPAGAASRRGAAASAGVVALSRAAATLAAVASSPPTVTRVDSSVQVTPDSTGRVTIPYDLVRDSRG